MTFPTSRLLEGVNLRNHPVPFADAPWLDLQYISDDDMIMSYVRNGHLPDYTPLFALECDDF